MVAKNKEISYCRQQYKVKTGKWIYGGWGPAHAWIAQIL